MGEGPSDTKFVVMLYWDYEGGSLAGIFSTKALAEAHITNKKLKADEVCIEEWPVDSDTGDYVNIWSPYIAKRK